ncbi:NAD-dependent epimerase/dehydratase family protein [Aquincola sp. MAHUQ-54]|uniref:NAD-dependent epimerase/dehydratase family protein n=1 Tax=Aquincola agrisoli TaxID=3119538 RepID=A0AAW9QHL3_9BURK
MSGTVLIAGAGGVVGSAAVEHWAGLPGWQVIALSRRRPPGLPASVQHVAADLTDAEACAAALRAMPPVTHLFYSALYELPELVAGWRDPRQMAVNLAMLRHLLDAIEGVRMPLRHITLMQGAKAYGGHVEPAPVPCKERSPRHPHENFYWLQEDLLRERQRRAAWQFSILRPQVVFGHAPGSPMNVIAALGAYAALRREQGLPLAYPGGGRFVVAASDSRLIAQAAVFAATAPVAAGQTYNVVNGDLLVWQDLWPALADHFGMPLGPDEPAVLAQCMPAQEAAWARIVERHGLQPLTLAALIGSSWQFADRSLGSGHPHPPHSVLSGIKLRQHGFAECLDTEDALHHWLGRLQDERLLPR